jgi:zinc protease
MVRKLPEIQSEFNLVPFAVEKENLSNGLNCYYINNLNTDVIKFSLVFKAGSKYGNYAVIKLLTRIVFDGSLNLKGEKFAEVVDCYGAYVFGKSSPDRIVFTLVCQKKDFSILLPVFSDAIFYPEIDAQNLTNVCKRERNALVESFQYNAAIAEKAFIPMLLGEHNPYGQVLVPESFDNIVREDLVKFHEQYINIDNGYALFSGEIGNSEKEIVSVMKEQKGNGFSAEDIVFKNFDYRPLSKEIVNPFSSQSYLLLGNRSIEKEHPDYIALKIVLTLLGGYMGSRLMQNIREKSGYTYDIYTSLVSNEQFSIFRIASEIKSGSEQLVLQEIEKEISKLQNVIVSPDELMRLKNYLSGELLTSFDGMFARDGSFLSVFNFGMELSYYQEFMEKLKVLDGNAIQYIANKYLNFDAFTKIIVKPD